MSHRPFKDRLYTEFASIGKALASAHRLELLDLLGQGERSVDELAQEIGQSLANTSAHLQVLRQARLVEMYLTDRTSLAAVDLAELKRLVADGSVTLLDVRPVLEYRQGHIPDARSVPVEELDQRLDELPRDREVVAYCRGPYCVFSDEAAQLLQTHGFRVRRFEDGFPEWRAAGLPVAIT